jgi:hypothetical protein
MAAWATAAGLAAAQGSTAPVEIVAPPSAASSPSSGCTSCGPTTSIGEAVAEGRTGSRLYGGIEYLLFGFRPGASPALIQILPNSAFPPGGGAPDATQAVTVFGDAINYKAVNGVRAELGYWVTDSFGLELSYAGFEQKTASYRIDSPGDPSIGRFLHDSTGPADRNTYLIFARPGGESGFIDASSPIEFWTFDVNVRTNGYSIFSERTNYLYGFRYADLRDSVVVNDFASLNNGSGITIEGQDSFAARNKFYGGQVGINSWFDCGCGFSFDITGKLALGGTQQQADISGYTIVRTNGVVTQNTPGHVLTQTSNIGSYDRNRFAAMPELIMRLGYSTGRMNFTLGYNFIAISSIVRAGNTIDENVNPNLSPIIPAANPSNEQRPAFNFNATDFWAQGLSLGVSLKY